MRCKNYWLHSTTTPTQLPMAFESFFHSGVFSTSIFDVASVASLLCTLLQKMATSHWSDFFLVAVRIPMLSVTWSPARPPKKTDFASCRAE